MDQNKLVSASHAAIQDRYTFGRIARGLLRRVPLFGQSDFVFLLMKGFKASFHEEGIHGMRLPMWCDHSRSVNLWDQREVLFRALVVAAIKAGIIDERRNFIDVGAQNGDIALSWSRLVRGVVYAIDPSPKNIRYLKSVATLNNLMNIDAMVMAVGEAEGYLFPVFDINHTSFTEKPVSRYGAKNPISATSFDALYSLGRIANIGFLHLDVEGMELQALRGATHMLKSEQPIIVFECHVTIDDTEALFKLLKSLGYSVYMINESTPGGRPDCVNFIAFPSPEIAEEALDYLNAVRPEPDFYKATLGEHLLLVP